MKRFIKLRDLFEINCKICSSNDIDINIENCHECGNHLSAECNDCDNKYDYHDFREIEVEYDNSGKEIWNEIKGKIKENV